MLRCLMKKKKKKKNYDGLKGSIYFVVFVFSKIICIEANKNVLCNVNANKQINKHVARRSDGDGESEAETDRYLSTLALPSQER